MIFQKIIHGILSLFVMVSLASASVYAIRPEATQTSEVLAELRSELRSKKSTYENLTYDYQGIHDSIFRDFVRWREEEIKEILKRDFKFLFSGFRLYTINDRAIAVTLILQKAFFDEWFKRVSRLPNNSSVTIPVIKEDPEEVSKIDFTNLKDHSWIQQLRYKPFRTPLKAMVFFYEPENIPFHTIQFAGQSYKAPVRVPLWTFPDGVLAINVAYLIPNAAVIFQELNAVLTFPSLLFRFDLEPPRSEIRATVGQAYSYEQIQNLQVRKLVRDEELDVREVLISGLADLLIQGFSFERKDELRAVFDRAVLEKLNVEVAIRQVRQMLLAEEGKEFYQQKISKIRHILGDDWERFAQNIADFKFYFSGFSFDEKNDDGKQESVTEFLEAFYENKFFFKHRAVMVRNQVTIPLMKYTPLGIAFGGKTVNLEKLWREDQRVPITAVLFYIEPDVSKKGNFHQVRLDGKIYDLPRDVPVWTFSNGILALNMTHAKEDKKSILRALEMVLRRYKPRRSELRELRGRSIQMPVIPEMSRGKILGAKSAFGIQAQEAFVIDSKLIQTRYDLAVLLAIFNHFPFVVLVDNPDTTAVKSIQTINEKLPPSGRVGLAYSLEESLQLLNQKIAGELRRPSVYPDTFTEKRLLLSDKSTLNAAALEKQLGDSMVVKTMTLDQFSQTAFGVANRSNLVAFANELHQKVLSQLLTAESA